MNNRRRMTGVVTSNKMTKTVVVEITRTVPSPAATAAAAAALHTHCALGWRQSGHMRPASVE